MNFLCLSEMSIFLSSTQKFCTLSIHSSFILYLSYLSPRFFIFFFLLFPVLLQSSCFSLVSCFHESPLFSNRIHPSCLQPCLLCQVPPGYHLLWILYSELPSLPPVPSTTPQHTLYVFPPLVYPAVHDAWLRPAMGQTIGSSGNQGSMENRNPLPRCSLQWFFPNPEKVAVKLEGHGSWPSSAGRGCVLCQWEWAFARNSLE